MASLANNHPTVVRTDRGLSISGTRLTVYDVMDYVTAGWPPHLIRDRLQLTDQQVKDIMAYIEANRTEVEREYQLVLQTAEENRHYWEQRNKDRLAKRSAPLPKTGQEELRAKLEQWKARQGPS